MKEKERKQIIRDCLDQYYREDKKILIDVSIVKVAASIYILRNLIYFGNKILYTQETKEALLAYANITKQVMSKEKQISISNAKFILEGIESDKNNNYQLVDMTEYGKTKINSIRRFLLKNQDVIIYLSDSKLYQDFIDNGFEGQIHFLEKGIREFNPFERKEFKWQTIGAITFSKEGDMVIIPNEKTFIRVYNPRFEEKDKNSPIKSKDKILIVSKNKNEKGEVYTFQFHEIVSRHSRHHAVTIIWTELKIGQDTNKYIDRLPYKYKKIIFAAKKCFCNYKKG